MTGAESHRTETGRDGEERAAAYLAAKGFTIVARNWRTRTGEIDIVARHGALLVFVEVKTLPAGNVELLAHELDERKRRRVVETSKRFLVNHREYSNDYIRYDVIVVDMPGYPDIYHIENAFWETV
ncbi:MAG: YraN family protein [Treponema sp.]|nr:YraN family protein [Treponema sp.]